MARDLILHDGDGDGTYLEKVGIMQGGNFISPLIISIISRRIKIAGIEKIALDENQKTPYAEQIISAGLRNMKESDFLDVFVNQVPLENALGLKWHCYLISAIPNLFSATQVRAVVPKGESKDPSKPGAPPMIDFFFNGGLNLPIEVALNVSAAGLKDHLHRFDNKYSQWKESGVVFHIDTKRTEVMIDMESPYDTNEAKNRVYTFLKQRNTLYRGSIKVRGDVSKHLPSPVIAGKSYSTFALRYIRRVAKLW
jgi:hypothetical protein